MPAELLSALLGEERRLLLSGDWDALEALAPRKAASLAALEEDSAGLAPLARDLARNQALLLAAIEGLREAGRRRATLASARARLVTYDAQGARAELPLGPPRVERRA